MGIKQRIACVSGRIFLAAAFIFGAGLIHPVDTDAADEIVIGNSALLTGVFGFAGVHAHRANQDFMARLNEQGGIHGREVLYVYEDTAYRTDASVAVFNRLTSQYNISAYYGDSTGFQKLINEELNRRGDILMAGTSFASEINDPEAFPYQFMTGPDYGEQIAILLRYIAETKPDARVVFVFSDTEFGRDPIPKNEAFAKTLGLTVAGKITTPPGNVDVSRNVLQLRRMNPDYVIFQGYVLDPVPEFIQQSRQMGLETRFMGTFWSMDKAVIMQMGELADGYMGVMPYNYYDDPTAEGWAMDAIRKQYGDQYQPTFYLQNYLTMMLFTEAIKRTLDADEPLTAKNMKKHLNTLEDFDTGGIIGVPITLSGNSIPVGRVYQADIAEGRMVPVSDWMDLRDY